MRPDQDHAQLWEGDGMGVPQNPDMSHSTHTLFGKLLGYIKVKIFSHTFKDESLLEFDEIKNGTT